MTRLGGQETGARRILMNVLRATDSGVLIRVRVQPRARVECLDG
ncbi:hypothetical protein NKDENANG_02480 [Candidatus Entotheonellaceae bacterium PAL068K]